MIDGDSCQIYFPNILSRFILLHYIGAIVTYTTHPKFHLYEKYQVVNLKPMIN